MAGNLVAQKTVATNSVEDISLVGSVGAPPPTVSSVNPNSGPGAGGTSVTITGSNFTGATAVRFGANPATKFTVDSGTQITATSPPGSGKVDITVTTPSGTSATNPSDQFAYITPPPATTGAPAAEGTTSAGFSGTVTPEGLATKAHFEYGLDSAYRSADGRAAGGAPVYDQRTPDQDVGSDFSAHSVSATVSRLVPNAVYHVRLVASNSAGTSYGSDQTFKTKKDPPPPPPVLGKSFDVKVVSGVVLIKVNGQFVPLTEARQIPAGAQVDARRGTLQLTTAGKTRSKRQSGQFGGAVFKITQKRAGHSKGLTTLSLLEGLFPGAPSYAGCKGKAADASSPYAHAARFRLSTLRSRGRGRFSARGRYGAGTVHGTVWDTTDFCNGTQITVRRGTVAVTDFVRHKTILVHAGHSYFAKKHK
jgi:hypothetical protein